MATNFFIVSFDRDSKTIYIELYYRIFISALFGEIFWLEILGYLENMDNTDTDNVLSLTLTVTLTLTLTIISHRIVTLLRGSNSK